MSSVPKRAPRHNRPGICLTEGERFVAMLGDAADMAEMVQATISHPDLEIAISIVRFVRARLAERAAAELGGTK
jgi:hypothetical protein